MSKDDTLDILASGSSSEFEGFSDSDTVQNPENDRGKQPLASTSSAGKKKTKVKSVVVKAKKGKKNNNSEKIKKTSSDGKRGRSSDPPVGTSDPGNILDLSKLSEHDIESLRTALGIIPQERNIGNSSTVDDNNNLLYDENVEDSDFYSAHPRDNIRVQVDACDISDYEDDFSTFHNQGPRDLNKDFHTAFDSSTVVDDDAGFSWDLPKVKAPERGDAISDSLSKLINTACTVQCDTDSLFNRYSVPSNCDLATPPLVNQEVWRFLDKKGHMQDKSLVDIQNLLSTSFVPVIKLIEMLKKNKSLNEEMKTLITDLITGLGQVQYNISLRRRYYIRPYLKKKYSPLCNMSVPITTKLFGDEISKEVKSCENISFLGKDNFQTTNFRGVMRSRGRFRGSRGYANAGNNVYASSYQQSQGFRPYPYPMRGNSFRGSNAVRSRAPRRRPTATVTSDAVRDPNERI
ncbi:uncharacterized protein LOC132750311 [Ruditapes philippinarum]|uniref:uncharacterized protein LOC132750311 n=1 Tax=Ruditapes philippinarum TaxID=129788 RepID=UPI00295B6B4E|nr:uncharacterized protein LOC132750311 [Ruditapes philippinarum]